HRGARHGRHRGGDGRDRACRRDAREAWRRLPRRGAPEPRGLPGGAGAAVGQGARMTMPRHLLLIGLPGAGKSTAGRLLAERLGTHCTDIDPMIERATGRSVAELFEEEGEESFRDREHLAVVQALALPPHVVAPGGGWAARPG